ncbi:M48 family metallopeptidase [Phycisphaera mikurensis]|uniref:Peptidase M48 family protein n=1 Tax=Phycisphaera mikurensis (strain NBRC 102666 / KCTC 22515 / FYK2301M01) TaxID=1142394 RepID=I0II87_PHYMF|nr:M48 family metallopeptidase [Phycisphaera mikurensis]MBB6442462.1 Zn-dependent protease with chaperone function [Phycisphaera mikurensis]BAM04975.1 peptidase M48 family protein [Phycisphaera mikurensis NBRC 102666]
MDFFEHQDRARAQTTKLIFLFVLAVICITALVYGLVIVAFTMTAGGGEGLPASIPWLELLGLTAAGVGLLVGGGSLGKVAQLRAGGGETVARSLGGRRIDPDTVDPDQRKVMNVVEEMAIASGLPVPPVFLMENEAGINAFAAGYTPERAVIGVTRGAIEKLSRDELQGVMAHEFSHILNGDMRLNIKLMGVIFGVMILQVIGGTILRGMWYSGGVRVRRGNDREGGGGQVAIIVIAFGLMAIGFVGVIFGRLIQAAVSRQREFLADASAVQFTRNPDGIAGALKVIGGFEDGAKLRTPHAAESAHMMFGNAVSSFGGAFATHPPLPERIKRLDPSWDGATPRTAEEDGGNTRRSAAAAGFAGGGPAAGVPRVGEAGTFDADEGPRVLAGVPEALRDAARRSVGAQAVLLCLLLDRDDAVRERQFRLLESGLNEAVLREAVRLAPPTVRLDRSLRLPVLSLCVPALSGMAAYEYRKLRGLVEALVAADDRTDRFEWALLEVLERQVGGHHGGDARGDDARGGGRKLAAEADAAGTVLAALCSAAGDPAAAFAAAAEALRRAGGPAPAPPAEPLTRERFGAALERLARLRPGGKRAVLAACTAAVKEDGVTDRQEAELLRVVAEAMGIPLPPIAIS